MQVVLDLKTPTNTATSLRQILDSIENHIGALESLEKHKSSFGGFLIPYIFGKLP